MRAGSWVAMVAVAAMAANCTECTRPLPGDVAVPPSNDAAARDLATAPDLSPCQRDCCQPQGEPCATHLDCCSLICGRAGRCLLFDECVALDGPCTSSGDCCPGLVCSTATSDSPRCGEPDPCSSGSCRSTGEVCTRDCQCCNLSCRDGACRLGDGCGGGDQCCADGEPCITWSECCSASCLPTDGGVNRCGDPSQ